MCGRNRTMNRMAFACFAGVAAFACGLVALNWYKSRRPEYRKRVRKLVAHIYNIYTSAVPVLSFFIVRTIMWLISRRLSTPIVYQKVLHMKC